MSRIRRKFILRLSMAGAFTLPNEYWLALQVTPQDVENLHTFLFERETPLTTRDLSVEFVEERVRAERFAAVAWKQGTVVAVRAGINPSVGDFDVLTVAMEDGSERMFAANLESHVL